MDTNQKNHLPQISRMSADQKQRPFAAKDAKDRKGDQGQEKVCQEIAK
jgi:hypothetical protein